MEAICGIYKITNKVNGKCYIGQSVDIHRRWKEHKARRNNQDSVLSLAFIKYGLESFTFEIIEECLREQLNEREIYWIDYYNSYQNGYNCTPGGEQGSHSVKLSQVDVNKIKKLLEFSNLTGLELAEIFNVSKDTITSINVGRTWRENREYPIRQFRIIKINNKLKGNKVTVNKRIKQNKNEKNKNHCIECGKEISYRAQRCGKCLGIFRRKATRPTKEELFNQLKLSKGNFTKVASSYNVTDNAIRKWCKSYNLPYHSSDYK